MPVAVNSNERSPAPPSPLVVNPGITMRETRYAPNLSIARHDHPWAFISLVLRGDVSETCKGATEPRRVGAVRLMPAGLPHANSYGAAGGVCLITELTPNADDRFASFATDSLQSHGPGTAVAEIARRLHSEFRMRDDLSPLALDGLLSQLFVELARARRMSHPRDASVPAWLERVRDRLHDERGSAPSLRALAAEAGVHPSHLVRAFRRHYRAAPAEYLTRLRIERACRALTSSELPLSQIALQLGFCDQAHFTRRFRAATGMTPNRYRAAMSDATVISRRS